MDTEREFLRHTLATLAYRAGRALEGAPDEFFTFAGGGRTPEDILAHMADLLEWATSIAQGVEAWPSPERMPWEQEKRRFFAAIRALGRVIGAAGAGVWRPGAIVPGADCRRANPHRTVGDAQADGGMPHTRGELFCGTDCCGADGRRAAGAGAAVCGGVAESARENSGLVALADVGIDPHNIPPK